MYHTDFAAQAKAITGNESLSDIVENATRFFYSFADEILVPSRSYMDLLSARGLERSRMRLFIRSVDTRLFAPRSGARKRLEKIYGITARHLLLYAGRISKDKGLNRILEIHRILGERGRDVHLLLVGEGPDLEAIHHQYRDRVTCTGRVEREALPEFYGGSDFLLFPSTTDTFGMVVLEAQSCGLPALVSGVGGPKEIEEKARPAA